MKKARGMVCTNSIKNPNIEDYFVDASSYVIDKVKDRLGKSFSEKINKVVKIFGVVTTLGDVIDRIDVSATDDVVFKLFEMAGIGPNSSDLGYLIGVMNKSYDFVSNDVSYYWSNVLAGKSLFQMDYEIYMSDNPNATKEKFINNFNASYPQFADDYKTNFKNFIKDDTRREKFVRSFKEYVLN